MCVILLQLLLGLEMPRCSLSGADAMDAPGATATDAISVVLVVDADAALSASIVAATYMALLNYCTE